MLCIDQYYSQADDVTFFKPLNIYQYVKFTIVLELVCPCEVRVKTSHYMS